MDWNDLTADLDAKVEQHLGDNVEYATDGVTFVTVKAFVMLASGAESESAFNPIDILNDRDRLKIGIALVPEPAKAHRIRSSKLGSGTFQPSNWQKADEGRTWIIDLQEV